MAASRGVEINLSQADLSRANLSETMFTKATRCPRADLCRSHLGEIHTTGADLSPGRPLAGVVHLSAGRPLRDQPLPGRPLPGRPLREANLIMADLTGARLTMADLSDATSPGPTSPRLTSRGHLSQANLAEVRLSGTIFGDTNLAKAKGLDSCRMRVLARLISGRSRGLGRCRWRFSVAVDFLTTSSTICLLCLTIPWRSIRALLATAVSIRNLLNGYMQISRTKGVRCWFAPEDMKIGDEFRSRIDQAIHVPERLLLILSEQSVKSRWVQKEVETAFEKEDKEQRFVLFPIRVDEAVMETTAGWAADIRRQRHIGDFTRWKDHDAYQKAFDRLLRDLTTEDKEEHKKATG